jgi:type VI protein secretion system component Hcp
LIADAVQGKAIGDGGVTLYCVSSGKVFLTYTLTGCLLTSVSDSGDTPSAQKDQIEILSFSWGAANVNLSP